MVISNTSLSKKPVGVSIDSIIFLEPGFSMWSFSGNFDFNFPIKSYGRTDTMKRFLTKALTNTLSTDSMKYDNSSNCIRHVFNSDNLRKKEKDLLQLSNYRCMKMKDDFFYVYFFFNMDVYEVGDGMSTEYDVIRANALIFKNGELLYSNQLRNRKLSKRSNFPRGSIDRKEFPHFTNEQIKLVVDKITEDLLKKIN